MIFVEAIKKLSAVVERAANKSGNVKMMISGREKTKSKIVPIIFNIKELLSLFSFDLYKSPKGIILNMSMLKDYIFSAI
jgi:hypothetical protein